jgi:hypothetical protein
MQSAVRGGSPPRQRKAVGREPAREGSVTNGKKRPKYVPKQGITAPVALLKRTEKLLRKFAKKAGH